MELHRDDELEVDSGLSRLLLVLEEAACDVLDPNVRPRDDPHGLPAALPVPERASDGRRLSSPGRACTGLNLAYGPKNKAKWEMLLTVDDYQGLVLPDHRAGDLLLGLIQALEGRHVPFHLRPG